jgi:hypothetical protein
LFQGKANLLLDRMVLQEVAPDGQLGGSFVILLRERFPYDTTLDYFATKGNRGLTGEYLLSGLVSFRLSGSAEPSTSFYSPLGVLDFGEFTVSKPTDATTVTLKSGGGVKNTLDMVSLKGGVTAEISQLQYNHMTSLTVDTLLKTMFTSSDQDFPIPNTVITLSGTTSYFGDMGVFATSMKNVLNGNGDSGTLDMIWVVMRQQKDVTPTAEKGIGDIHALSVFFPDPAIPYVTRGVIQNDLENADDDEGIFSEYSIIFGNGATTACMSDLTSSVKGDWMTPWKFESTCAVGVPEGDSQVPLYRIVYPAVTTWGGKKNTEMLVSYLCTEGDTTKACIPGLSFLFNMSTTTYPLDQDLDGIPNTDDAAVTTCAGTTIADGSDECPCLVGFKGVGCPGK